MISRGELMLGGKSTLSFFQNQEVPMSDSPIIFKFIVDSLRIAGAEHNVIHNELIMCRCPVQVPRSFFTPARTEMMNLQMVCRPELLNKYPGSELVTRCSFRLQWFIDGIRQRGRVTRGTCSYDLDPQKTAREITALWGGKVNFYFERPTLRYQPHLLVNFQVGLETDEKFEESYSLSINLVNGLISSDLLAVLANRKITPTPPTKNLEKRKIPYREGYEALRNHLQWLLQNHDHHWVEAARERWTDELKYLEQYYLDNPDSERDSQVFYRQTAELYRKYQPVIRVKTLNTALLFLPFITYTVEAYDPQKPLPPLVYDPLYRRVQWGSPTPFPQSDKELP
jgi:hypothetical protein